MSHSKRDSSEHIKLFIPGPTEVRPEILDAQTAWMIGHRMPECADLFESIQGKLRQVFKSSSRVYVNASSGTGLQEAAVRNCSATRVLNCVNGAFSERWRQVTEANGKANDVLHATWGQPITPEAVAEKLMNDRFDAITVVHNETSTGVTSPIGEIASAIRDLPGGGEIMILVDSVSGLSGARLEFDNWDLDVVLTSSQKAFALPPGLAMCAVSDRALARAQSVAGRGYYFDFVLLEKYLRRNQTPATPAISLMYALDKQLDDILAEGLENRFARHLTLRDKTMGWARDRGFSLFATQGYESPTVTCINNDRDLDIPALNQYLRSHGMIISHGYGPLKGKAFRVAHMGDVTQRDMETLLETIDAYLTSI
ncbi:MAG: alanine--glyoxylate aminotransferase family protein [Candidatus Promineifilaceae bacterium]|nr:alanine--glyoxylate aminotransferase family protein [Candidatus Promineifilaceae bacterium]